MSEAFIPDPSVLLVGMCSSFAGAFYSEYIRTVIRYRFGMDGAGNGGGLCGDSPDRGFG